jgi:hypothetical protein
MKRAFQYSSPSPGSIEKMNRLRQAYSDLADLVEEVAPASRERSAAITELETSAMWVMKAVTHNDPESTPL